MLATSFCTIRLSFSPASTYAPSSRIDWQTCWNFALSLFSSAAISGKVLQPPSIASSTKASRVPEVGGGPSTSILTAGSVGSTSFRSCTGSPDVPLSRGRARSRAA
jgi:hypothetical protein